MADPTFVGVASAVNSNNVPRPALSVVGVEMIASITVYDSSTDPFPFPGGNSPVGWTFVDSGGVGTGERTWMGIYRRVMQIGDPTSWAYNAGGLYNEAMSIAFLGAGPSFTSTITGGNRSSGAVTIPAETTTTADSVLWLPVFGYSAGFPGTLAGWTVRHSGIDGVGASYSRVQAVAGSTGTVAITPAGNTGWAGGQVVVPPSGGGGTAITKTPGDVLGLTDAATKSIGRGRTPSDLLGLTDALSKSLARVRTAADNLGLTDALSRALGIGRSASDTIGLTDGLSQALGRAQAPNDTLGLTDATNVAVGRGQAPADQLGLTDAAVHRLDLQRTASDTEGLTDTLTVSVGRQQELGDSLGLVDTVTITRSIVIQAGDNLGLTDNAVPVVAGSGTQTIGDNLGLTDALTVTRTIHIQMHDTIGLVDSLVRARALQRTLADQLGMTDQLTIPTGLATLLLGTQVVAVRYLGDQPITAVYVGAVQVWP